MSILNPLDEARDLTACLQHYLAINAIETRRGGIGVDQRTLDSITYRATDLEDVLGRIEAERIRADDERGLIYQPTDDVTAMREVLTQAWLAGEPVVAGSPQLNKPLRTLAEAQADLDAAKADLLKEYERVVWPELAAAE